MKRKSIVGLLLAMCMVCLAIMPGFAQKDDLIKVDVDALEVSKSESSPEATVEDIETPNATGETISLEDVTIQSESRPLARSALSVAESNAYGTYGGTLTTAGNVSLYLISVTEPSYLFTRLTASDSNYKLVLFSVDLSTGSATQATNLLNANSMQMFTLPQGDWGIGVVSMSTVGSAYSLGYNHAILSTTDMSMTSSVYPTSDWSTLYTYSSNLALYVNGVYKTTFTNGATNLSVNLSESQSWSNGSGLRNSTNFYNSISDVQFTEIIPDIYTYRRRSYSGGYISSNAVIFIPISSNTLFHFTMYQYTSGVQTGSITWDPYTYDKTPKRLTASEVASKTYIVYDINTNKAIDIMGKYNLIWAMGYVDEPTYSLR